MKKINETCVSDKAQDEANFRKRLTWDWGDLCEFMRPDPVTGR